MTNEPMIKNDPIAQMKRENTETNLFNGVAILLDDESENMVIYHEGCDTDILVLDSDNEFSEVLDKILNHLGECVPDEEDANDPWEDLLNAEDEENEE